MANPDFDTLASTTLKKFMPGFQDNIFKERVFLAWIVDKARMNCEGGLKVVKPIMYGENTTVGSYKGYDTLPCTPQKGMTAAEYEWCQYSTSISLCGAEMKMNSGAAQHINLLRAKTYQAQESTKKRFARDLLLSDGTGNQGKDVAGLEALIGDANHNPIFGGIDASKADCAFWQSFIDDAGYGEAVAANLDPAVHAPPKPLTWEDIANAVDCISCNDSDMMPDLILLSKELYQGLRSTMQPHLTQSNPDMARMGFKSLEYCDIPIVWDPDVPKDTVYILNSRYINLTTLQNCWLDAGDFKDMPGQDAICAFILSMFMLCTDKRSAQGKLCNRKPAC